MRGKSIFASVNSTLRFLLQAVSPTAVAFPFAFAAALHPNTAPQRRHRRSAPDSRPPPPRGARWSAATLGARWAAAAAGGAAAGRAAGRAEAPACGRAGEGLKRGSMARPRAPPPQARRPPPSSPAAGLPPRRGSASPRADLGRRERGGVHARRRPGRRRAPTTEQGCARGVEQGHGAAAAKQEEDVGVRVRGRRRGRTGRREPVGEVARRSQSGTGGGRRLGGGEQAEAAAEEEAERSVR